MMLAILSLDQHFSKLYIQLSLPPTVCENAENFG